MVRQVKGMSEDAKVAVRNARHDGMELIKDADLPEDETKKLENDIQDIVNKYNKKIEDELEVKENDLMSV